MRYLLVVGFFCDVYRKEPRARIFVEDKLIDEFEIKNLKFDRKNSNIFNHILEPFNKEKLLEYDLKNLPLLKYYSLEIEDSVKFLDISIDIKNNDNNYNNGFFSKNTLIRLQTFYFLPINQKLINRVWNIQDKNKISKNYAWFRSPKRGFFDCIGNTTWKSKKEFFNSVIFKTVGGSGTFSCKLIKKYNFFIPSLKKSQRFFMNRPLIDYFFNKYQQYENQRNTD